MPTARSLAPQARETGVWLGSRVTNGILGFVQVSLATAAVGPREAGRFFLLWTAVWLLATVLKFGVDGILPRVVAEARLERRPVPSLARPAAAGLAAFAVLLGPLFALFRVPVEAMTIAVAVVIAFCWAATFVLSGALKAEGQVARSGVVINTVWPLGPALAPLILLGGGDWRDLAEVTSVAAAASLAAALAISGRSLGALFLRRLASRRAPHLGLETDAVGAAFLSLLYELIVWLPVVAVALLSVGGTVAAAVFTAVRVGGTVSWPYNAIVASLTPRIATALAGRDIARTRGLLKRGSVLGLAVTLPLALAIALAAKPIMHLFDSGFGIASVALVLLVVGRVFDAAAGPVGEALLVGRGTWLDSLLVSVGVLTGLVLGASVEGVSAATAAGLAGASAFTVTNVLRIGVVWRLLARGWRAGTGFSPRARTVTASTALVLGIGMAVALGVLAPKTRDAVWIGVAASLLAAAGVLGIAAVRHTLRSAVSSPLGVLALILAAHFALRPATLALDPPSATWGLRTIGFYWREVTIACALGAGGLGLFGAGFAIAWGRRRAARIPAYFEHRRLIMAVGGSALVGTVLWGILFERLGGTSALSKNPTAIHLGQYGAGYGTFGLCLCLGAVLVALQAWLSHRRRGTLVAIAALSAAGVAGSIALATRSLAVATALAAAALALRAVSPRARTIVAAVLCFAVFGTAAIALRAVRDYSQYEPTSDAVSSLGHTPPLRLLSPDLIEFDYLVALQRVVPHDLGWLDGRSVTDVPAFFVPRKLWPGKPKPLDFRLSSALANSSAADVKAGTPFTLPGEAWWNFRFGGALAFLLALGAVAGLAWRLLLERGGPAGELVAALMTGYSYLIFTRPLGPMLLTMAMAAAATLVVYFAATARLDPARVRGAFARSG